MKINRRNSLALLALSIVSISCNSGPESSTTNSITVSDFSVPEFAQRLNSQKSVDYGGVFAVLSINGMEQRIEFSDESTQSIEVTGIEMDANNAIRIEWWELFMGTNLQLSHQEGTLYIASSDLSSAIPFAHVIEPYDYDEDGKPNLAERQQGTCPVPQPCAIEPPTMININAGNFLMGAVEPGMSEFEYPQHMVSINAFSLAEAEVTWADWEVCVDANACTPVEKYFKLAEIEELNSHPVGGVSYEQIEEYIVWINQGLGGGYRLPTEAEFEYALRAGTTGSHSYGDNIDNYCEYLNGFNSDEDCQDGYQWSSPVKSFPPNAFGLYDMNGNIDEWTADCWHDNYIGAPTDGSAWRDEGDGDCNSGVLRGSNYYNDTKTYRSSLRRKRSYRSEFAEFVDGFRLARD